MASALTDDQIAQIEMMAEDGFVTARMVVDEFGIPDSTANSILMRMVKNNILELGEPKYINRNIHKTYVIFSKKPEQTSMFSRYVKRDKLVAALFGNDNRDSEAAWVF